MLLSFAVGAVVVWIVVCGIFLGLIPDTNEEGEEAVLSEAPTASEQTGHGMSLSGTSEDLPVPVELLVYRLERQIRMEEAAARNYIDDPSTGSLHASSSSATVS